MHFDSVKQVFAKTLHTELRTVLSDVRRLALHDADDLHS